MNEYNKDLPVRIWQKALCTVAVYRFCAPRRSSQGLGRVGASPSPAHPPSQEEGEAVVTTALEVVSPCGFATTQRSGSIKYSDTAFAHQVENGMCGMAGTV